MKTCNGLNVMKTNDVQESYIVSACENPQDRTWKRRTKTKRCILWLFGSRKDDSILWIFRIL